MASGRLGAATPPANIDTLLYTVPICKTATLNIGVVNCHADETAVVRVALTPAAATPTAADWIEYAVHLSPGGVLERYGIVAGAGEGVYIHSSAAGCTARVHGFEGNL